jgi:hypothetical protein
MSAGEDDDLKLQRSSVMLLADIERMIPKILYRRKHDNGEINQQVKEIDVYRLFVKVRSTFSSTCAGTHLGTDRIVPGGSTTT